MPRQPALCENRMVRTTPVIDFDGFATKPQMVISNLMRIAAFALTSGDAYADEVASGRRSPDELGLPGAILHVGARPVFSEEILPPYRQWIVTAALRDVVECMLKFLDDARDVRAICRLPRPIDTDGATWRETVVIEGDRFHRWGLAKKLDFLRTTYGIEPPSDLRADVESVNSARNCLVHRDGIVLEPDKNSGGGLEIRWRCPALTVLNPGTERLAVSAPGAELKLGGSIEITPTVRRKTVAVGKRVTFTNQELSEIGSFIASFMAEFALTVSHQAKRDLVSG